MIAEHQPTIFPDMVRVGVSSLEDGTMKWGTDTDERIIANRQTFLSDCDMSPEPALIQVLYEGDDYCRYQEVTAPGIVTADALATQALRLPLLLPLADCTGTVLYDPTHHALMVSHLGRHSTEQFGAKASVNYMEQRFGTRPSDVLVWLSPAPSATTYPLWQFENRSFQNVLREQLLSAGVTDWHIEQSEIDTAMNPHYFSHSQFLQGKQAIDGRYAIAAHLV